MNIFPLIRLLLAHFVGDFFLQNEQMCKAKREYRTKQGILNHIAHALLQAMLSYIFVANWICWQLPLIIFATHLAIDMCKSVVGKEGLCALLIDQLAHLLVITALFTLLLNDKCSVPNVNWLHIFIVALAYVIIISPSAVFIETFNKRFELKANEGKSLTNGGKSIGYLERVLILSFILSGWMEGIGFLLAAKSVFRFGDLKNNKELRQTEYVLVGTFLSFTIAILIGLLTKYVLNKF